MKVHLICAEDSPIKLIQNQINQMAPGDWPILITGETGVGKELFAREAHRLSGRPKLSFIPVNCGAIPPALFESELFGHERGAFSGAVHASPGLIRTARGGTLFLDEVGDLDLAAQVKLLRFLDSGEVRAVGCLRTDRVPTRVIAATNANLIDLVRKGRFRRDLFERLNVVALHIPPLRERRSDIVALAEHWTVDLDFSLTDDAKQLLSEQPWMGNARQLRNSLVRLKITYPETKQITSHELFGALSKEAVTQFFSSPNERPHDILGGSLAEIERRAIVERLRRCSGNRRRAARELGIAKSTLHEKIRRWREVDDLGHFADGQPDMSLSIPPPPAGYGPRGAQSVGL